MGDINRDPELDRTRPDPRSELERVVGADSEGAEAQDGGGATKPTPLEPTGAGDVEKDEKAAQ